MTTIAQGSPAREVLNQAVAARAVRSLRRRRRAPGGRRARGRRLGHDRLRALGALAGSAEVREHGRRAERNEPVLVPYDRFGNRVDAVELDPSWHWLLRAGDRARDPLAAVARPAARRARRPRRRCCMLWANANGGVLCPVSMTYAVIPALRDGAPELAAEWEPRLTLPDYERGALAGMAMTEQQGGSDVRANITRAEPVGDGEYELHGHKWFCSYPPCDVFLVLAQAPERPARASSSSAAPGMEFQRLKDKLGTRSLPSSEVEFRGIRGRLVGEEGRGVQGDHPDGQPHAARLPARLGDRDAPRRAGGDPPRAPPLGVRRAARRPAGDAERARRPRDRVRGRDRRGAPRRRAAYDQRRAATSGASPPRS